MKTTLCAIALLTASLGAAAPAARAVDLNFVDTFESGTVQEWYGGTNITNATNGQGGAGDHYLRVQTTGTGGAGSHLAMHNAETRWTGDFLAPGVTGIQLDMINLGTTSLSMRLVIFGLGTRFTSNTPVTLAPGSGWQHVTFPVSQTSLTRVLGSATYSDALTVVSQVMFRHDAGTASSGGETVNGIIGYDNIRVLPAPGAAALLGLGGLVACRRRRA